MNAMTSSVIPRTRRMILRAERAVVAKERRRLTFEIFFTARTYSRERCGHTGWREPRGGRDTRRRGSGRCLNKALRLQYRSALGYTLASGGMFGFEYQGFSSELADFGRAEIDDTRRLVEKITTFEGEPTTEVAPLEWSDQPEKVVEWLIDAEAGDDRGASGRDRAHRA